ncbi:MAG: hypothetical protein ABW128_04805 [Rhizorhabdus sp.]
MARDLNLAFSVIQRVALGVNSQMAIIPILPFVLSTTLRRPWALTHEWSFSLHFPLPNFGSSFIVANGPLATPAIC